MRGISLAVLSVTSTLSLGACSERPPPPPPGPAGTPAAVVPASQPASAASAASLPADHSTSSAAVSLTEVFAMPETPSEVVLRVNQQEFDRAALEAVLRQVQLQLTATQLPVTLTRYEVLRGAVDQLVDREMARILAAELGVKPDPEAEKAWIADLEARVAADPAFAAFLLRAGKDEQARKRDAEDAARMDGIVAKLRTRVEAELVTEARRHYDRNLRDFTEHEGREAWRIFIKAPKGMIQRDRDAARARADDVFAQAKREPARFEDLARSYSEGGKGHVGGSLGWVAPGTLASEIEAQIFAAKPNTVLPVYDDAYGFYIYKVGGSRKQRTRPFEEVKAEIMERVFHVQISQRIEAELERLRKAQTIEVLIPELSALEGEFSQQVEQVMEKRKALEAERLKDAAEKARRER